MQVLKLSVIHRRVGMPRSSAKCNDDDTVAVNDTAKRRAHVKRSLPIKKLKATPLHCTYYLSNAKKSERTTP